ncbi:uncharacterized protein [Arachis hypogaea]|uniref:uncharacterized protein n=1 Tax=Arachis hypogaea TaxID=3818 RepID=UPI003B21627E
MVLSNACFVILFNAGEVQVVAISQSLIKYSGLSTWKVLRSFSDGPPGIYNAFRAQVQISYLPKITGNFRLVGISQHMKCQHCYD